MGNGIDPKLNELLSFAWEMSHYVTVTSPWRFRNGTSLSFDGTIQISEVDVPCSYEIDYQWHLGSPAVTCREKWVRREIDWHVFPDGKLCWVYPRLWIEVIRGLQAVLPQKDVLATAVYWCVEHSSSLIAKHLEADRMAYTGDWPEEWDAWAHGNKAKPEYEKDKREGKVDRIVQELIAKRIT